MLSEELFGQCEGGDEVSGLDNPKAAVVAVKDRSGMQGNEMSRAGCFATGCQSCRGVLPYRHGCSFWSMLKSGLVIHRPKLLDSWGSNMISKEAWDIHMQTPRCQ